MCVSRSVISIDFPKRQASVAVPNERVYDGLSVSPPIWMSYVLHTQTPKHKNRFVPVRARHGPRKTLSHTLVLIVVSIWQAVNVRIHSYANIMLSSIRTGTVIQRLDGWKCYKLTQILFFPDLNQLSRVESMILVFTPYFSKNLRCSVTQA